MPSARLWLVVTRATSQRTCRVSSPARSVVIDGKVEGPISGEDVVLKSQAFVTGDIQAQTLFIERGAHFEGRSLRELLGL